MAFSLYLSKYNSQRLNRIFVFLSVIVIGGSLITFSFVVVEELGFVVRTSISVIYAFLLLVITICNRNFGLYLFGLCVPFVKVSMNLGVLSNSTLHLMSFALLAYLTTNRKVRKGFWGVEVFLLFLLFIVFQATRSTNYIEAYNVIAGYFEVFIFLYYFYARCDRTGAECLSQGFVTGVLLLSVALSVSYDWINLSRMGENLGLGSNNLGLFCAMAITIMTIKMNESHRIKISRLAVVLFLLFILFLSGSRTFLF